MPDHMQVNAHEVDVINLISHHAKRNEIHGVGKIRVNFSHWKHHKHGSLSFS